MTLAFEVMEPLSEEDWGALKLALSTLGDSMRVARLVLERLLRVRDEGVVHTDLFCAETTWDSYSGRAEVRTFFREQELPFVLKSPTRGRGPTLRNRMWYLRKPPVEETRVKVTFTCRYGATIGDILAHIQKKHPDLSAAGILKLAARKLQRLSV